MVIYIKQMVDTFRQFYILLAIQTRALSGVCGWGHCLGSVAGVTIWYQWLGSVAGVSGWSQWLGSLSGISSWGQWLGSLSCISGWGQWLGSLSGISGWCQWLWSLSGISGWGQWLWSLDICILCTCTLKVAPYSFTIERALGMKVQVICARSKGNVSVFLYFITST